MIQTKLKPVPSFHRTDLSTTYGLGFCVPWPFERFLAFGATGRRGEPFSAFLLVWSPVARSGSVPVILFPANCKGNPNHNPDRQLRLPRNSLFRTPSPIPPVPTCVWFLCNNRNQNDPGPPNWTPAARRPAEHLCAVRQVPPGQPPRGRRSVLRLGSERVSRESTPRFAGGQMDPGRFFPPQEKKGMKRKLGNPASSRLGPSIKGFAADRFEHAACAISNGWIKFEKKRVNQVQRSVAVAKYIAVKFIKQQCFPVSIQESCHALHCSEALVHLLRTFNSQPRESAHSHIRHPKGAPPFCEPFCMFEGMPKGHVSSSPRPHVQQMLGNLTCSVLTLCGCRIGSYRNYTVRIACYAQRTWGK